MSIRFYALTRKIGSLLSCKRKETAYRNIPFTLFRRIESEVHVNENSLLKQWGIEYLGHKIIRNSIVHIPAENEPVFFSYSWDIGKWER